MMELVLEKVPLISYGWVDFSVRGSMRWRVWYGSEIIVTRRGQEPMTLREVLAGEDRDIAA